jgi:UDP-N-acetylmuramoyl-tripeptide--D-alanyl-D-alanine ligase
MDAYNANPTSMKAAIDSFAKSDYKDKMLILGDMLELGEESRNEHIKILNIIEDAKITDVILVGPIFCEAAKGLNFNCYNDSKEAATGIKEEHITGKAILLKASRGIRLESIVKYL